MVTDSWIFIGLAILVVSLFAQDTPSSTSSTSSYLTESDKLRLKKVIEPGFTLTDAASTYYAVVGYKLIQEPIPKPAVSFTLIYVPSKEIKRKKKRNKSAFLSVIFSPEFCGFFLTI